MNKKVYEYDDLHREISYASYDWENGAWVAFRKNVNTYNVDGYILKQINYEGYNSEGWALGNTYTVEYDNYNNRLTWQRLNNTSTLKHGSTYTYDYSTLRKNVLMDISTELGIYPGIHKIVSEESFKYYAGKPVTLLYHYTPLQPSTISTIQYHNNTVSCTYHGNNLYFSGKLQQNTRVTLYDLSGRKYASGGIVGNTFAVPLLSRGVYIVEILTEGRATVQKVSVE